MYKCIIFEIWFNHPWTPSTCNLNLYRRDLHTSGNIILEYCIIVHLKRSMITMPYTFQRRFTFQIGSPTNNNIIYHLDAVSCYIYFLVCFCSYLLVSFYPIVLSILVCTPITIYHDLILLTILQNLVWGLFVKFDTKIFLDELICNSLWFFLHSCRIWFHNPMLLYTQLLIFYIYHNIWNYHLFGFMNSVLIQLMIYTCYTSLIQPFRILMYIHIFSIL